MAERIRLAFIGTGVIVVDRHWPAVAALPDEFEVVAVVNRTRPKADALADTIEAATGRRPQVYTDHRTLFAAGVQATAPNAVSLGLPPTANPEVAHAALAAGCHVIAEKPIAASLEAAREMLPWSEQYGRVLMIAENWRYLGGFRCASMLLPQGIIGRIVQAHWVLYPHVSPSRPYYSSPWRQNPIHPGGYLSDGGVHHAAAMRRLLGEAVAVRAAARSIRPDLPPLDSLTALITWDSGVTSSYQVSYAVEGPETPLTIVGTEGALVMDRQWVELRREGQVVERWDEPSPVQGMVAMYRDFARAVRGGGPPLSTPAEATADLQLIVALLRSAVEGAPVEVGKA